MAIPDTKLVSAGAVADQPSKPETKSPSHSVNYLNRCIEDITTKAQATNNTFKTLNLVIGYGTGVLFIAAAVASIVLTAIFAPASIPLAALGAFCLTPIVLNFTQHRFAAAALCASNAQRCEDIREILEKLPTDSTELTKRLRDLGVNVADISDPKVKADPTLLRPVLAHYLYWHAKSEEWQKLSAADKDEQKTHGEEFPAEREQVTHLRLKSIAEGEAALISKTNAAFYLGLLKHPDFSKGQDELFIFHNTVDGADETADLQVLGQRALSAQFGDSSEDKMISIAQSDGKIDSLTRFQLKNLTEAQIANKLFA